MNGAGGSGRNSSILTKEIEMIRRIAMSTMLAITGAGLTGCVLAQRGSTMIKWETGTTEVRADKALAGGVYALYRGSDFKPQRRVEINEGTKYGFRPTSAGKIEAFWGEGADEKQSLEDGKYYWNYLGKKAE